MQTITRTTDRTTLSKAWPIEAYALFCSVMDHFIQKPNGGRVVASGAVANGVLASNGSEYTATVQVEGTDYYLLVQEIQNRYSAYEGNPIRYRIPVEGLRELSTTIEDVEIL